ncbi:glycine dehydrogenase [Saprolegnia parasitica CBS 223.65]|uniref:Glycine cleavage system P protein n=1 Tax=Saprolegnia parasitica (strain CBS 223.65) TaxID=695850 RepID=A0A067CV14_SAPPC|nr:glycine dehydrogenase [Saprolegnia parasitica CBS 223.65]KDO30366.1 glycine dehydrogenase [Saprolegnia parasitica CBS 223.65]|eukprot:XP_012198976.1 glycine dehydrogenase [Saprolegnia parasitica CBS 223.65]
MLRSVKTLRVHASLTKVNAARAFSAAKDPYRLTDQFARRHIGASEDDTAFMLNTIGEKSLESLIKKTVPKEIRLKKKLNLPAPMSESQAMAKLRKIAKKNKTYKSFIGTGFNDCLTPFAIKRNLLENPGWYTAYTPYQAEVSQGRLEMLLNFQTMLSDLTGFPIAGASLLDEGTAAAEAMALCHGAANGKRTKFFVASDCHPQTIAVLKTRAEGFGIDLVFGNALTDADFSSGDFSGTLIQYPNTYGSVADYEAFTKAAHDNGTMVIVATDLLALTQLKPPAEFGADIAVGSAQRFGVPLFFGGPHAGFIATTEKHHRKLPGRIIGVSKDSRGERALRMAMQTREQHIRRDKATSNICTAQALLANIAASYAIYHGPDGLRRIATRANLMASTLVAGLSELAPGVKLVNAHFFDTIELDVSGAGLSGAEVQSRANAKEINVRVISPSRVGVAFGESADVKDIAKLLYAFGVNDSVSDTAVYGFGEKAAGIQASSIPASLRRSTPFLEHRIFNSKHSETELMRYLKTLEDKDLSLNTSMISLGSCTMKLNSVAELEPVSWNEFMNVHPFAPVEQTKGYLEMIEGLHKALAEITGFAAVSSQPNSGAQGEYAGLLAIRSYQKSIGEGHRNVCLIPVSAHGTNPASAVMAGMKVVVIKSDAAGNIDRADLEEKAKKHAHELSALMITYPSTFGVFEEGVKEMVQLIHDNGGQVYMDGANMNAQVALTNPGSIGADVCHLNLHKTFCIPHGGGGPGVGSIGVARHLAPFLPGNPITVTGGEGDNVVAKENLSVSSGPFGSAGILPISWMYIHMLGEEGLKKATSHAILHANYMAKVLESHYDIVFRGSNGTCAHEFIIDIRPFKQYGIVEEDVAKRLQDYGFHSPTMSWPVPGTLMIEPTESENLSEMNRFCQAMILIRKEIDEIAAGKIAAEDSPLKHAPHTIDVVTAEAWDRKYPRAQAAFPAPWHNGGKTKAYWPTVGRVDNVFGDRNLVCSCPPMDVYLEE